MYIFMFVYVLFLVHNQCCITPMLHFYILLFWYAVYFVSVLDSSYLQPSNKYHMYIYIILSYNNIYTMCINAYSFMPAEIEYPLHPL
jgi:hypothetical protein